MKAEELKLSDMQFILDVLADATQEPYHPERHVLELAQAQLIMKRAMKHKILQLSDQWSTS